MRARASLGALLLASGLLSVALAAPVRAAEYGADRAREQAEEAARAHRPAPSPKTLEHHAQAIELLFQEHYDEAVRELDRLIFSRLNEVEQGIILRDYAYIASARGDHAEARRRLEAAIASGGLLPEDARDARFQIAMLWMQEEGWKQAAETLEVWFSEEPDPNAASYYILALCYFQEEDYEHALAAARKSIEMTDQPKEDWLRLLLGIHLIRGDHKSALPVLEELLALYPSKAYLVSLSTVYGALGSYEQAAIPLQLAYEKGLLDSGDDLRRLGQLLLYLNQPYDAATLLAKGLDDGVIEPDSDVLAMLSNSWIAAREYEAAVEPLERAAALAENGQLYVRLAQVHVQRENWSGATDALTKALAKGDLEQAGEAQLLMGIALYSEDKPQEARGWFDKAKRFESVQGEAKAWIEHIDRELASQAT